MIYYHPVMNNHNNRIKEQFITPLQAWLLSCIYGMAATNLFNQGDYSPTP
jgi:hypothetical protein